jgi:ribokinase
MTSGMLALLICIGSINLDVQVRTDEPLAPGATRRACDFLAAGGGKAANRALLARALGIPATLIGNVGTDEFAARALRVVHEREVDLSCVFRTEGQNTGVSLIVVGADGDKTILHAANANQQWQHRAEDIRRIVDGVHSDSVVSLDLEVPPAICEATIAACRSRNLTVVVDPSPASTLPAHLYASIDYLTPNPVEAQTLTGIEVRGAEDALRAADDLARRGARNVCVKLPGGGCALRTANERSIVRPPPVRVVDKNGAGDAFAGALSIALLERRPPLEAARWATAAAALALTEYGAQADFIDRRRLALALEQVAVRA